MTQLVRMALRMRPDRILVGEVSGPEALDLLMAWNTGHEGGIASVHANNAAAGLNRLSTLVAMYPNAPRGMIESLIGEAVDVIVHIARTDKGRVVQRTGRAITGLRDHNSQKPGIRIPGGSRAFGHAAIPPLAAEPGLHRNDAGQEIRGSGRPEKGARNRRSQRSCRGTIFRLIRQTCYNQLAGGHIATVSNCGHRPGRI